MISINELGFNDEEIVTIKLIGKLFNAQWIRLIESKERWVKT